MIEWAVGSAYGTMVLKMVVLTCHFVVCLSKMNDNLDCYSVSAAVGLCRDAILWMHFTALK